MANAKAAVLATINLIVVLLKTIILALIPDSFRKPKSIKGAIALVTGGGNGLGRQLALRLSKLGASVVVWDIDQTGLEETCARIRAQGGQAKGYKCDVSNKEEIYKIAAQVKEDVGSVSILLNNAGIANGKVFWEIPDEAFQKVVDVNIMSHVWTCKAFLPDMIAAKKGHIVATASIAGYWSMMKATEYCSTKHAVVGFMEALKMDLLGTGVSGISTTTVCPYFIDTGMFTCKYDGVLPMLKTSDVVNDVIEGILLDKERIVIPRSFYLMLPWKTFLGSSGLGTLQTMFGGRKLVETIKLVRSPSK